VLREPPPERLRRRHVDGKRVEGTPQEEVDRIGRSVRALLSGRPARVAESHRPDGARAGALEPLDGGRRRILTQGNLASSYERVGRLDEALLLRQEVYSERLKLHGEEHEDTLREASNYASTLNDLQRYEEAKSLLRKTIPVARRVVGTSDRITLTTRWTYAMALYEDPDATLDDVREAVATLEDAVRIGRRVLGGAHPMAAKMEKSLQISREALRARESGQNVVFNPR
jgi:tetratricopeptide (TPR) repeat protein